MSRFTPIYKTFFKPGTFEITSGSLPGLSFESALISFLLDKGLATNPSGDCCTLVPVSSGGSGGSVTDLSWTRTATSFTIESSDGLDVVILSANSTQAGAMPASDKVKVDFITVTQAVDLDALEQDVADLTTLSGVPSNATNLGTFSGVTIPDNLPVKPAIQALETEVETKQNKIQFQDQGVNLGSSGSVTTVNFTGSPITASLAGTTLTVDVTSTGGGLTDGDKGDIVVSGSGSMMTIDTGVVSDSKLADMPANTVKVRNAATPGTPVNLAISNGQLVGRGSTGDIVPIVLGTNLSMSGSTLNALAGAGGYSMIQDESIGLPARSTIDFLGAGVTVTDDGSKTIVTIPADTVTNGLTGNGQSGTPHKLGGSLIETTTINGVNNYGFVFNNLGGYSIVIDNGVSGEMSQVTHTPLAVDFIKKVTRSNTNKVFQLVLTSADGGESGLEYFPGANPADSVSWTFLQGANLATSGLKAVTRNFASASTGQALLLQSDGTIDYGSAGSSDLIYQHNGAMIKATGAGVTFTRDTASVWTINVPSGVELKTIDIYSAAADNPGANVTLNINTTSTVYNQSVTTLRVPLVNGVNLGSGTGAVPANYAPTTGSTNLYPSVNTVGSGDIQLLINNFNNASGLGTGATILKISW
jgi:hypothetical protein